MSCVVVWDRNDYIKEADKQLNDTNFYKDVYFNDKLLQELVWASNKLFENLKAKGKICDKQLKYFTYQYKKFTPRCLRNGGILINFSIFFQPPVAY